MAIDENDDLSSDIAAAFAEVETGGSDPAPVDGAGAATPAEAPKLDSTPAVEQPKDGERPRDDKGRFAPKGEDAPEQVKAVEQQPQAAPEAAKQPEEQKPAQAQGIPAPMGWSGKGKVKWNLLPQDVQKELATDYQRFGDAQARLQRLDAVIGPQRATALTAQYGGVEQGIQQLLALSDMAASNPAGFIQWFAQQRGINLTQYGGQGAKPGTDQPQYQQPNPEAQRIAQLESRLAQYEQSQNHAVQSQAQSEIERFATDPSHPYFNDVKVQMGALMSAGKAKDMQQAYDMACWADPDIRSQLLEDHEKAKANAEAAKVQAAQRAQVSISGSPAGARVPVEESDDDLETLIRKEARARGLAA